MGPTRGEVGSNATPLVGASRGAEDLGVGSPSSCSPRPLRRSGAGYGCAAITYASAGATHFPSTGVLQAGEPAALVRSSMSVGRARPRISPGIAAFSCSSTDRPLPSATSLSAARFSLPARGVCSPRRGLPLRRSWYEGAQLGARRGVPPPSSASSFLGVGLERAGRCRPVLTAPLRLVMHDSLRLAPLRRVPHTAPLRLVMHVPDLLRYHEILVSPDTLLLLAGGPLALAHTRACDSPRSTLLVIPYAHGPSSWHRSTTSIGSSSSSSPS